jgi:4-amino-4-deoxy-L-arabinose transferase-like glycosyltransferase
VPTKLPHYILPVYPALALLCALWVTQRDESDGARTSSVLRIGSLALFMIGAAAVTGTSLYLPMRFGGHPGMALLFGAAIGVAFASAAMLLFFRNRVRSAAAAAFASAICFDVVLGSLVVPQLHGLWLSPRAARLVVANKTVGDPPPVLVGYVEPSLVFLLGPDTRIAPPIEAAGAVVHGGIALVERRAAPMFLKALASSGAIATPLGKVSGMDYSVGREEEISLYRVLPAQR